MTGRAAEKTAVHTNRQEMTETGVEVPARLMENRKTATEQGIKRREILEMKDQLTRADLSGLQSAVIPDMMQDAAGQTGLRSAVTQDMIQDAAGQTGLRSAIIQVIMQDAVVQTGLRTAAVPIAAIQGRILEEDILKDHQRGLHTSRGRSVKKAEKAAAEA